MGESGFWMVVGFMWAQLAVYSSICWTVTYCFIRDLLAVRKGRKRGPSFKQHQTWVSLTICVAFSVSGPLLMIFSYFDQVWVHRTLETNNDKNYRQTRNDLIFFGLGLPICLVYCTGLLCVVIMPVIRFEVFENSIFALSSTRMKMYSFGVCFQYFGMLLFIPVAFLWPGEVAVGLSTAAAVFTGGCMCVLMSYDYIFRLLALIDRSNQGESIASPRFKQSVESARAASASSQASLQHSSQCSSHLSSNTAASLTGLSDHSTLCSGADLELIQVDEIEQHPSQQGTNRRTHSHDDCAHSGSVEIISKMRSHDALIENNHDHHSPDSMTVNKQDSPVEPPSKKKSSSSESTASGNPRRKESGHNSSKSAPMRLIPVSVSRTMTQSRRLSRLSGPELQLLDSITRQTVLSLACILSAALSGLAFVAFAFIEKQPLIQVVLYLFGFQNLAVIPLCTYLMYPVFSDPWYLRLCSLCHRAIRGVTLRSPSHSRSVTWA